MRKKYKRTNIVAGKCGDKIISPLVYDKIMDSKFFEKWFKEMFLHEVEENKAIVMIMQHFIVRVDYTNYVKMLIKI